MYIYIHTYTCVHIYIYTYPINDVEDIDRSSYGSPNLWSTPFALDPGFGGLEGGLAVDLRYWGFTQILGGELF